MTKTLCFQTDCTGRFYHDAPTDDPEQPHLVRLAWVTTDDEDDVTSTPCMLITPRPDWEYDPDAVVGHLVTPEAAAKYGIQLERAMSRFIGALEGVDDVVAYNMDFHRKLMQRSAAECGLNWPNLFTGHRMVCAMRAATDIVKVPRMRPGGGYQWPKLTVAYEFFTGEELPVDLDPIQRGLTLANAVHRIYQGIVAHNAGVSHE